MALAIACVAGAGFVLLGVLIARRTGLLDRDGDLAETVGVGLSLGLLAFTAVWASVASGGRSVFVPIALTIVLAIVVGRGRPTVRLRIDRRSVTAGGAAVAFLVAIGLLYATTIAPSPRNGYQPIEFFDVGYYSVLGADLADTGVESIYSPAGFDHIPGLPEQTWYHWGELWLAAAAIDLTGVSPMQARHLIVLPLLLLAAATLVGALVRRLVSRSTEFFLLGAAAMLFLAPIPILRDANTEWFARSLVISITQYGLSVVVIVLGLYGVASHRLEAGSAGALVAGALTGSLIAAHVGLAVIVGAGVVAAILALSIPRIRAFGLPNPGIGSGARVFMAAGAAGLVTIAWGFVTGHGLGGLAPIEGVLPFDAAWRISVLQTVVGAGVLLAAPLSWYQLHRLTGPWSALVGGAIAATIVGAVAWGVLVGDLNTFHLLFGPVVALLTPMSIAVVLWYLRHARRERRRVTAIALLVLTLGQTVVAGLIALVQLPAFGPLDYPPTPSSAIAALRALPAGAKAAYACSPTENFAPWDSSLVSIDAHTGVAMVPMCFMADRPRRILGRELDPSIPSPFFRVAPQRSLYPDVGALPDEPAVRAFLAQNGIGYIYADRVHVNALVPDAPVLFTREEVTIHSVP